MRSTRRTAGAAGLAAIAITALAVPLTSAFASAHRPMPAAAERSIRGYAKLMRDDYLSTMRGATGSRAQAALGRDAVVTTPRLAADALSDAREDVADDAYAGMTVKGAAVTASIDDATVSADGTVTADVEIDTEVQVDFWRGGAGNSGETDDHTLTLKPDRMGRLRIVRDSEEADDSGNGGKDPHEPSEPSSLQTKVGTALGPTTGSTSPR